MKKIKVLFTAGAFLFAVVASFAFKPSNITGKAITTGFYAHLGNCNSSGATDQSKCDVGVTVNLCTVTLSGTTHSPVYKTGGSTCASELFIQP